MADNADILRFHRVLESDQTLSFFHQRQQVGFVASVVDMTFHGEHSLEVEERVILRNIETVRTAFNDNPNAQTFERDADGYLESWKKAGWFGTRRGASNEILISLQPSARDFISILERQQESYRDVVSTQALTEFEEFVERAATKLSGDQDTQIAYIDKQIEELQAKRKQLAKKGVEAVTDITRKEIAKELRHRTGDILEAVSRLPKQLQEQRSTYTDWMVSCENDTGQQLFQRIGNDVMARRAEGAYQVADHLRLVKSVPSRAKAVSARINEILNACSEFMSFEERVRLETFFTNITAIAADIVKEEAKVATTLKQSTLSQDFKEIQGRARALRSLKSVLLKLAETAHLTPQDSRLEGVGLRHLEPNDLRLERGLATEVPVPRPRAVSADVKVIDLDEFLRLGRERKERTAQRERTLRSSTVSGKVRNVLEAGIKERRDVTLAEVLAAYPPTEGLEEIIAYQKSATQIMPSKVSSHQALGVQFSDESGERELIFPSFIFTADGNPGVGLQEWEAVDLDRHTLEISQSYAGGTINIYNIKG